MFSCTQEGSGLRSCKPSAIDTLATLSVYLPICDLWARAVLFSHPGAEPHVLTSTGLKGQLTISGVKHAMLHALAEDLGVGV